MNALFLILLFLSCHKDGIEVSALNSTYAFNKDTLSIILKNNIETDVWYTCSLLMVNSSYPDGGIVVEDIKNPFSVSKSVVCEKLEAGKKVTIRIPAKNIGNGLVKYFQELKSTDYIYKQKYKIRINYSVGNNFKDEYHVESNIFKFSLK